MAYIVYVLSREGCGQACLETLKPSLKIHHHLSMISKRRIYAPSVAATWVYVQRSWNIVAEQLGVVAHAVGRHNHMVVVG